MEVDTAAAAAAAATTESPSELQQALQQLPETARKAIEERMIQIEAAKQEQQKIANEATAQLENGSQGDKVYLEQQLALLLDHLGAVGPRFNVAGVAGSLDGPGAASAVSRLVAACNTKFMGLDANESSRPAKRARQETTEAPVEKATPEPARVEASPIPSTGGSDLLRQALAAQYS